VVGLGRFDLVGKSGLKWRKAKRKREEVRESKKKQEKARESKRAA
jgi:hypothetical protein